jgi:hypothetical protein
VEIEFADWQGRPNGRQLLNQRPDAELQFHSRQRLPDAPVNARAECEVLDGIARDVEAVRILKY